MNKMNLYVIVLIVLSVAFCTVHTDATVCAPYSTFKIDCDDCKCSGNGKEYSCIPGNCASAVFLNENKKTENVGDNSAPGAVYPREATEDVVPPYPYLNDEIPSSREKKSTEEEYDLDANSLSNKRNAQDGYDDSLNNAYQRDVEDRYADSQNNEYQRNAQNSYGDSLNNAYQRNSQDSFPNPLNSEYQRSAQDGYADSLNNAYQRNAEDGYADSLNNAYQRGVEDGYADSLNNVYQRDADDVYVESPNNMYQRDIQEVNNEANDVGYIEPQNYRRRRDFSFYN